MEGIFDEFPTPAALDSYTAILATEDCKWTLLIAR